MAMDIKSGEMTSYDGQHSVQPLDASATPGVQQPTLREASGPGQGGVLDTTGEFQAQMHADAAIAAAVQSSGEAAEHDRRAGYQAQALPLGGHIGDELAIPLVPDAAVPPAMSDLYPWPGQEPTPASAGMQGPYPNTGNEPR